MPAGLRPRAGIGSQPRGRLGDAMPLAKRRRPIAVSGSIDERFATNRSLETKVASVRWKL